MILKNDLNSQRQITQEFRNDEERPTSLARALPGTPRNSLSAMNAAQRKSEQA